MPTSLRQLIINALVTRCETISTGNGYETNAGSHVFVWRKTPVSQNNLPVIIIRDTLLAQELTVGVDNNFLHVGFECVTTAANAATQLRSVIGDIFRVLKVDLTFGGLAEDVTFVDETFLVEQEEQRIASAEVSFDIQFTTDHFDPDQ